jgi:predicted 3-demethylubiquinone-9 3-methyltransferase (glyoxalase superfamily)
MAKLSKIHPCLWFDDQAEDAAKYYVSVFPNAKITHTARYVAEGQEIHGKKPGSVMSVVFELDGMRFMALNGGAHFKLNEAVSFVVLCDTQAELDHYWSKLSADPKSEVCGWCKDKFGLSWQIVPSKLDEWMSGGSDAQRSRLMQVVMASRKLDIARMEAAFHG